MGLDMRSENPCGMMFPHMMLAHDNDNTGNG
jgi:hypothetical protein